MNERTREKKREERREEGRIGQRLTAAAAGCRCPHYYCCY
jgi:hypothetical protein